MNKIGNYLKYNTYDEIVFINCRKYIVNTLLLQQNCINNLKEKQKQTR